MKSSERGAILIFVALTLAVLMALGAFAVDYGMLWMARGQAQNAADAGALAGAVALAYDSYTNVSPTGPAYLSAMTVAGQNTVSQATKGIHVDVDPATVWEHPAPAVCGTGEGCIQVDVYTDGTHGSTTLPTYFANVFGQTTQLMKATATGMAATADSSNCVRPWMIPDKWQENSVPPNLTFDVGTDIYIPPPVAPATTPVGTGYSVPQDIGAVVTLKPGDPKLAISPSDYYVVDVDPNCTGGNCYRDSIGHCVQASVVIGQTNLTTEPGNMVGPTKQGVGDLVALDPTATWNGTSVVNANGLDNNSPRIVPIAMFSPEYFTNLNRTSGRFDLPVVNMLGFFVESISNGGDVTGVLVRTAGTISPGGVTPGPSAAFLSIPILVR